MESLDFLKDCRKGNATLSLLCNDGKTVHIHGLDLEDIEAASPLLACAFEETRSGPRHCLEDVSPTALTCLLRYIYSKSKDYVPEECKQDLTSLLLHAQLYYLADIYNVTGLLALAKSNMTKECEFSCYSRQSPTDLCRTIDFAYQNLSSHKDIIEIFTNYCVSMFLYHRLDQLQAFKDITYYHRQFQQDLCAVNISRGFVDDAALAIIQLPIKPFEKTEMSRIESMILRDVLYEMWSVSDTDWRPENASERPSRPTANTHEHRADVPYVLEPGPQTRNYKPVTIPYRRHKLPSYWKAQMPAAGIPAYELPVNESSGDGLPADSSDAASSDSDPEYDPIAERSELRERIARILLTPNIPSRRKRRPFVTNPSVVKRSKSLSPISKSDETETETNAPIEASMFPSVPDMEPVGRRSDHDSDDGNDGGFVHVGSDPDSEWTIV